MSGIYLPNIEKYLSCQSCPLRDPEYGNNCSIMHNPQQYKNYAEQYRACPLKDLFREAILVPDHGDLIERDKLRNIMFIGEQCLYSWDEIEDAIDYAPTIIPADPIKEET